MAELSSSRKTQNGLNESEMAAAQQLMQLSDEDSNNNISNSKRNRSSEEEVDQTLSYITLAKIEEIFGKDEVFRPKKQRRYRSLVNIYMATTPINVGNVKNVGT